MTVDASRLVPEGPQLLVISDNEDFVAGVTQIMEQLRRHKAAEFGAVPVHAVVPRKEKKAVTAIGTALSRPTFFCLCDAAHVDAFLSHRNRSSALVPFCVVVDKYELETMDQIFTRDPFVRGVIKSSIGDPEDSGQVARMIKEEWRNYRVRHGEVPAKMLKWKIDASSGGTGAKSGQLASLFVDATMRTFMQHLLHAVDSIRRDVPKMPLPYEAVWEAFRDISYDRDDKRAQSKQALASLQKFGECSISNPEPILIEGESGVGKTVMAQWIARYLRKELVRVSTVNIGSELLETELFGTVVGGFTGAVSRPGRLLLAWGNVVFLDEIGDLPVDMQAKLLVYLDDFEFQPVGWGEAWKLRSPVYIVAATNRDVRREIERGAFREDLYYRFKHRLRIPPLRERRSDLRPLIDLTLQNPAVNRELQVERISIAAIRRLEAYEFPGNVRELQSVLSDAVFRARLAGRTTLLAEDLSI